jgi:fructuronate reductase
MMQRLSKQSLDNGNSGIIRPQTINPPTGIVHLGSGAFHRAHQVIYTEDAMAVGHGDWGVCGVSLKSTQVQEALRPQNWLYTLAVLDTQISYRIVGALSNILIAAAELPRVLDAMTAPATHIFTVTVTEKGYCLNINGDLNTGHPDIQHDLQHPRTPSSVVGIIVEALRRRFAAGVAPPTVISCDNLTNNGRLLANAVLTYANLTDRETARWIEDNVCFPCTMVDSITPATDDALRERVAQETGLIDMLPVQREAYTQWVIENRFCGPKPEWEAAGAILTDDVIPYENAKLRLLNAAHSTLAYLGSLLGIETVFQAMQNPLLPGFIEQMMLKEIAPTVDSLPGLKINDYAAAILQRFKNPAIKHYLSQIALDGSLKIPIRILETVKANLAAGRSVRRLCLAIAGWMHFVRTKALQGQKINDPLADRLLEIGANCTLDAGNDVGRFMALQEVFGRELPNHSDFIKALTDAYKTLGDGSAAAITHALHSVN